MLKLMLTIIVLFSQVANAQSWEDVGRAKTASSYEGSIYPEGFANYQSPAQEETYRIHYTRPVIREYDSLIQNEGDTYRRRTGDSKVYLDQ